MEIAPGIYVLREVKGIYVHAFLLNEGEDLTLIDTLHSTHAKSILSEIQRIGKTVADLKRIVLTHAHRAHLGGLALLKRQSGAGVYCHEWEADIVAGDRKPQCMSLKPTKPYILWPFQIASRFGRHPSCPVDHLLQDGDQVGPLHVVHTPGHTPGHLAFYWPERRALFAGDALVTWPEFEPGWLAFNLNSRQNLASLHRMAEFDTEILAVGHGDPITGGGNERLRALLEKLDRAATH
jgi:glyoxylase-like metal-dependent hydrolase (beta-lactamase superfamily II)